MDYTNLPKVDNETVFSGDFSKAPDQCPPIGTVVGIVFGPSQNSESFNNSSEFVLWFYNVSGWSMIASGTQGAQVRSPTLEPAGCVKFPVTSMVYFMGAYRAVPPVVLRDYLNSEHLDLLRVIEAGLIDRDVIRFNIQNAPVEIKEIIVR